MVLGFFKILMLLILIKLSSQQETTTTRFVYQNFLREDNLSLDGSTRVLPNGILQLTDALDHQKGHVFYNESVSIGSSFSTHFICALVPQPGVEGGHGMAFVVSPSTDFSHAEATRYLGIFNVSKNGTPSSHVLAVELDTIWNPDFEDIDSNHVGIDVNSPLSVGMASASYYSDITGKNQSIKLLSGEPLHVWLDYEASLLNVSMAPLQVEKPSQPLLSHHINLSDIFPNTSKVFVGFSASTGTSLSYQYVLSWSFSTKRESLLPIDISRLPEVPPPRADQHKKKKLSPLIIVLLGSLVLILSVVLVGLYLYRRRKYEEVTEPWEKEYDAVRFSYRSLYKATRGFSQDVFLGRGGFGEVYRGNLPLSKEIAVKRMSHDGGQGVKQFVAEVVSMRCLKHKNLVPLLGYCRRKHELLLVSEYMTNGSLDQYLFNGREPVLSWLQRFVIVKGIASALSYLHKDADKVVIHRDIKAANVMLDSKFEGRLGDFGMASFHEHGGINTSTAAVGTLGYMAPEIPISGASTATDVYAFGVFLLEVACGRRPIEPRLQPEKRVLIKWVCECWKRDGLVDAIDPRMRGELVSYEEVEMVMKLGLLCSSTMPEARPTMEEVVLYLNKNLPLPDFSPHVVGISNQSSVLIDGDSLFSSSIVSSPANTSTFHTAREETHIGS